MLSQHSDTGGGLIAHSLVWVVTKAGLTRLEDHGCGFRA